MTRTFTRTLLSAALLLLAPSALAQSSDASRIADDAPSLDAAPDAPGLLTYSGLLTDAEGHPLPDGEHTLTFRAYASQTATDALWTERHDAAVAAGQFWVVLGTQAPLTDGAAWYTVSVDGAPESRPVRLDGTRDTGAAQLGGTSLDQAYDAGQVINIDQGRPLVFRGTPGAFYTGLQIQNITATFTGDELVRFRLRSVNGGASWEYRVYGAQSTGPTAPPPGSFAIANASNPGAINPFVIRPSATQSLLRLVGSTVNLGDDSNLGDLKVYTTTDPAAPQDSPVTAEISDHFDQGGRLRLFTEDGERYGEIEPLFDGRGGYMRLDASDGSTGFEISGGSGPSGVRMAVGTVTAGRTVFDTGETGTNAVVLPIDAVSSAEIQNEAGAANQTNPNMISLSSGFNITLARSITVPTSGYVMALGTGELRTTHTTGSTSNVQFAVSHNCESPSPPPGTQQTNTGIPGSAPTGSYLDIVSVHGLFEVSAGTTTFCSVVQVINSPAAIDDQNLTLIFVPTAYGLVSTNIAEGGDESDEVAVPALTTADVQAERAASIEANEARILAEIEAMRARLDVMEARNAGNSPDSE